MYCSWECKLIQPLWRTVWRVLKKLKIELSYDSAVPLLGIYPKTIMLKDTCTPVFIAALFRIVKTWKQSKYPTTDEWIRRCDTYIHTHTHTHTHTMEHYSTIKRNKIGHL